MIHHTVNLVNIRITMEPQIPNSVSQSIGDCAPKISQDILGSNPMYVMRLDHELTQCIHCKAYVQMGVHQEH